MKNLKTFPKGGVHPHDYKELTNSVPIRNAIVPSEAIIPLQQHIGAPAKCIVQPGDTVTEGMLVGEASGFVSANIHSSIPGTVKGIEKVYLANGTKSEAVVVQLEGEFEQSGKELKRTDWEQKTPAELLDKVKEMGIVGMGGATFPTHVKYTIKKGSKVEFFVVNGVECEPYLTADHRIMLERTDDILEGIEIIRKILDPEVVLIGIEENKPDAISLMEERIESKGLDIHVVPLKMKYPQGDEKQLLKALTGREVPSGGLPLDIGAVVSNVGTVLSIFEAVVFDKPLIERVVTVTGDAIAKPGNLKVRVGTKIGDLIEDAGGFVKMPVKIIAGGPMMGFAQADLNAPVTKGVSGIIALSGEVVRIPRETPCLQCGKCIRVCPMGLSPTRLYKWIDHMYIKEALNEGLMDCKECGSCAYICPAGIPLVQGMKLGKYLAKSKKV